MSQQACSHPQLPKVQAGKAHSPDVDCMQLGDQVPGDRLQEPLTPRLIRFSPQCDPCEAVPNPVGFRSLSHRDEASIAKAGQVAIGQVREASIAKAGQVAIGQVREATIAEAGQGVAGQGREAGIAKAGQVAIGQVSEASIAKAGRGATVQVREVGVAEEGQGSTAHIQAVQIRLLEPCGRPIVGAMPSKDPNHEPLGFSPQPDMCSVIPNPLRFSHHPHTPVRLSPLPSVQIAKGGLTRGVRDRQNQAEQRALSRSWVSDSRPRERASLGIRRLSFPSCGSRSARCAALGSLSHRHSAGRLVQANKASKDEKAQDKQEISTQGEVVSCNDTLSSVLLRFSAPRFQGAAPQVLRACLGAEVQVSGTHQHRVSGAVSCAMPHMSGAVSCAMPYMSGAVSGAMPQVSGAVSCAMPQVSGAVSCAMPQVSGAVSGAMPQVPGAVSGAMPQVSGAVSGVMPQVPNIILGVEPQVSGAHQDQANQICSVQDPTGRSIAHQDPWSRPDARMNPGEGTGAALSPEFLGFSSSSPRWGTNKLRKERDMRSPEEWLGPDPAREWMCSSVTSLLGFAQVSKTISMLLGADVKSWMSLSLASIVVRFRAAGIVSRHVISGMQSTRPQEPSELSADPGRSDDKSQGFSANKVPSSICVQIPDHAGDVQARRGHQEDQPQSHMCRFDDLPSSSRMASDVTCSSQALPLLAAPQLRGVSNAEAEALVQSQVQPALCDMGFAVAQACRVTELLIQESFADIITVVASPENLVEFAAKVGQVPRKGVSKGQQLPEPVCTGEQDSVPRGSSVQK